MEVLVVELRMKAGWRWMVKSGFSLRSCEFRTEKLGSPCAGWRIVVVKLERMVEIGVFWA